MEGSAQTGGKEQDWRLQGELRMDQRHGSLHALIDRIREPPMAELRAAVPEHVVLTHDGRRLFAYAVDRATIEAARTAIDGLLEREGIESRLALTHWEHSVDEWVTPASAERSTSTPAQADGPQSSAAVQESRTMVASAGGMVREEFEQTMLDWAARLGLRCSIVEHPHLLSTQVAFTVTGSRRKIDEFASGLSAEGRAMIRTETAVMLSPL